jgi:hypothetical protein
MPHGSAAARALPELEAISRKPASRPSPNTRAIVLLRRGPVEGACHATWMSREEVLRRAERTARCGRARQTQRHCRFAGLGRGAHFAEALCHG